MIIQPPERVAAGQGAAMEELAQVTQELVARTPCHSEQVAASCPKSLRNLLKLRSPSGLPGATWLPMGAAPFLTL